MSCHSKPHIQEACRLMSFSPIRFDLTNQAILRSYISESVSTNVLQLYTHTLHRGHIESHLFAVTHKTDQADHSVAHVTVVYSRF